MKNSDNPNDSGSLPTSDEGITGGTANATDDASMAALQRGYTLPADPEDTPFNPFSKQDGGFAGRPSGWAR